MAPVLVLRSGVKRFLALHPSDIIAVEAVFASLVVGLHWRRRTDPVWLLLVGPPASGKTEVLTALPNAKRLLFIDDFTTAYLVSGSHRKDGEGKPIDPSFLAEVRDCYVVIKDIAPLLTKGREHLNQCLGILRGIYDGRYSKGFGTLGRVAYGDTRFGMTAAATPEILDALGGNVALGERFLRVLFNWRPWSAEERLPGIEHDAAARALGLTFAKQRWRDQFREVIGNVFRAIEHSSVADLGSFRWRDAMQEKTAQVAASLARLRAESSMIEQAAYESPARLAQQIGALLAGHACICGSREIRHEQWPLLAHLLVWNIPPHRARALAAVLGAKGEVFADEAGHTLRRWTLRELHRIGCLARSGPRWTISPQYRIVADALRQVSAADHAVGGPDSSGRLADGSDGLNRARA